MKNDRSGRLEASQRALLGGGLLIGAALLLLFPLAKPIWTDEWISIGWGHRPLINIVLGRFGSPDALPLHPLLLYVSRPLLGDTLAAYRFVSALPAAVGLWYVYLIGKRFSISVGLLSLWLCALSPGLVLFDRMSRYHGTTALLVVMSCYFLLKLLETGDRKDAAKYSVTVWLMLMSYVLTSFVVVAHFLLIVLWWRRTKQPWLAIGAMAFAVGSFSFWLIPNFLRANKEFAEVTVEDPSMGLGINGFLRRFFLPVYVFCVGETVYFWNFPVVMAGITVFSVAFLTGTGALRRRPELLLPLVCFLVVFLSAVVTSGKMGGSQTVGSMAKRVSFVLPLFYTTCAVGIFALRRPPWRAAVLTISFGVALYSLGNYWLGREFLNPNYTVRWQDAIAQMQRVRLDDETTVYNPMEPALEYYVREAKPNARIVTGRELQEFLSGYHERPTRYVWVFGRDRGDRRSVAGYERVRDYLARRYVEIYTGGVMPRSASERRWIGLVLKRDVWPTYLRFELYDMKQSLPGAPPAAER